MNYIKNISISIGLIIISLIVLILFITTFSYFNILNYTTSNIFKMFIPIISLFIGGFYIGKKSQKKGWLEGLKLGLIFLVLLIIFEYLGFDDKFEIKKLLYYLIITSSSIFGSIIGINKKKVH